MCRLVIASLKASLGKKHLDAYRCGAPMSSNLPHHAGNKSGLAPRRLYFLFQKTVRFLADIARSRIGPGSAFVVLGAGCLADFIALTPFKSEIAVIAAGPVDRGFGRAVARFDHDSSADAGDAAIILNAPRHAALQPAHSAAGGIGRIVEAPRPAAPVTLAHQSAIDRIAGGDRRTLIIATGAIEIGLSLRRPRGRDSSRKNERHPTRPEQAGSPHTRLLSTDLTDRRSRLAI